MIMNPNSVSSNGNEAARRARQLGQVKVVLLIAIFAAGVAAGALWFSAKGHNKSTGEVALSDGTKAVLRQLDAPVEIRFYSLLDPASVPASLQAYADRVPQLLAAYEREGGGKVKVGVFNNRTNFDANGASADGIKPFNLSKGDACYLGITVTRKSQKEVFSQLGAEWEAALESDLSRCISRLAEPVASTPVIAAPVDPAAVVAVQKTIPNLGSVTVDDGKRIIRENTLNEFQAAISELEGKIKEAEQNVLAAQTDADKQAAISKLHGLQAQQMEKLQEIAAKLKAQSDALEQLKQGKN